LSATANLQTFSVFAICRIRYRGQERFLCAYVCRPFIQPIFTCSVEVPWMSLYFSAAVWLSLAIAAVPRTALTSTVADAEP